MLWTGGKDCALALHESLRAGFRIAALVTFVPEGPVGFRAHPVELGSAQATALGLELRLLPVRRPYRAGYTAALLALAADGIDTVVTGDIGPVDRKPNWVRTCARGTGVRVRAPLWGRSRPSLLRALVRERIDAVLSYIRSPPIPATWLGRHLDGASVGALIRLARAHRFDACGEQGEYHTWVVNTPLFARPPRLRLGAPRESGPVRYLSLASPSGR